MPTSPIGLADSHTATGTNVARPHTDNGAPEVLTRSATAIYGHEGFAKDHSPGLSWSAASGWRAADTVVPMDDKTGDRCKAVVVRVTPGDLIRHNGTCDGMPGPASPKVTFATGFDSFDTVLTTGDLTGEGRADILGEGLTLIGAGDMTGAGHGDLMVRDSGGELRRYNGTGRGTVRSRALVLKDWGAGRNAIVGAGDLNGDGKNDLISRDTSDRLLRNLGNGTGSFGRTVEVGSGRQDYRSLH
ncbi:FG-GAP repeat domain-containing protein [Streptomyces sp. NPDC051018]|uniref:FG-GAP repeat domain-containing protein n=1 Tax=Streptomyces sp. NPDC051018 TaxID=3365639 RepID=UPI00379FEE29